MRTAGTSFTTTLGQNQKININVVGKLGIGNFVYPVMSCGLGPVVGEVVTHASNAFLGAAIPSTSKVVIASLELNVKKYTNGFYCEFKGILDRQNEDGSGRGITKRIDYASAKSANEITNTAFNFGYSTGSIPLFLNGCNLYITKGEL